MKHSENTIETVCQCNRFFNEETLHPLVSIVNREKPCREPGLCLSMYAVALTGGKRKDCGWQPHDYTDATLLAAAPGERLDAECGRMLVFHPDLLSCTPLGKAIHTYTFFSYRAEEALHLSCRERGIIDRLFDGIDEELHWGVDRFSKTLIVNEIELLLNYILRYRQRQLITRHDANAGCMDELDRLLDGYFASGHAGTQGMPTAGRMAQRLGLSEAYLADLLLHETGQNIADYAQLRRLKLAKEQLLDASRSIDDIACRLGYCSTSCFASLFHKLTGVTPEAYRGA